VTTKRKCRAGSAAWLRGLYNELNAEFFENKLPHNLEISWATLDKNTTARVLWKKGPDSKYIPYRVEIDAIMKPAKLQKKCGMSMLHEMVHIKSGLEVACEEWDGEFDKEMFKLAAAGAFRLFW
jgi:hypothetical protein